MRSEAPSHSLKDLRANLKPAKDWDESSEFLKQFWLSLSEREKNEVRNAYYHFGWNLSNKEWITLQEIAKTVGENSLNPGYLVCAFIKVPLEDKENARAFVMEQVKKKAQDATGLEFDVYHFEDFPE